MNLTGKTETFAFDVRSQRDWREVRKIVFDQGWRAMRDRFYDEAYNNKDWYAMRAKYRPMAAECLGAAEFSELMKMMLGELNASHMGHRGGTDPLPNFDAQNEWSPITYHLGLRFELGGKGPGLEVESVIPGSPCDRSRSLVNVGESRTSRFGMTPVGIRRVAKTLSSPKLSRPWQRTSRLRRPRTKSRSNLRPSCDVNRMIPD